MSHSSRVCYQKILLNEKIILEQEILLINFLKYSQFEVKDSSEFLKMFSYDPLSGPVQNFNLVRLEGCNLLYSSFRWRRKRAGKPVLNYLTKTTWLKFLYDLYVWNLLPKSIREWTCALPSNDWFSVMQLYMATEGCICFFLYSSWIFWAFDRFQNTYWVFKGQSRSSLCMLFMFVLLDWRSVQTQ